jgi:hypothetical protein
MKIYPGSKKKKEREETHCTAFISHWLTQYTEYKMSVK